jgi:hypothetical protein
MMIHTAELFQPTSLFFQRSLQAHRCNSSILTRAEKFRLGTNRALAMATIHEQPFLLIRYCGNQPPQNEGAEKNYTRCTNTAVIWSDSSTQWVQCEVSIQLTDWGVMMQTSHQVAWINAAVQLAQCVRWWCLQLSKDFAEAHFTS